ncbi:MAG: bestrophin-like domain [Methyloceanibacter sp.]
MFLLRIINYAPLWLATLGVLAAFEVYAVGLMLLCRRIWGADRLKLNNEVAGFKFSVIGVLYAVLLGFVVIAVWEGYRNNETAVRNEAKAVADLLQISYALPEPSAAALRTPVIDYANQVRKSEWPAMARGFPAAGASHALAHLTEAIFEIKTEQFRDLALYQQALRLLAVVQDNRNERLDAADGSVPPVLWFALVAGAMITLGYPAFFGTSNLIAQTLMTALLAALVAFALVPAVILDYPFTGDVTISSAPFDQALREMAPHEKGHPPTGEVSPAAPQ